MALRLHDFIIRGEVVNTSRNATNGVLILSGADRPIVFNLTGDCAPDLRGRHVRFKAVPPPKRRTRQEFRALNLAPIQVGPTGHLSAAGWVRTFECSVEEFCRRAELGEPPPTTWKRRLYLNWYSQNCEVTIELGGAKIEYLDGEAWKPLPHLEPMPPDYDRPPRDENAEPPPPASLEIDIVSADGQTRRLRFPGDEDVLAENALDPDAPLLGDPLQRALDERAAAVDRAIRGETEEECEAVEAARVMDDCLDRDAGIPLVDIFKDHYKLPDADRLSDEQVEGVFKIVLSQLALLGIAFHVCEHFTIRQAYKLLKEKVCPDGRVFDPPAAAGWVQGFMTSEYCPACEEAFEREYREFNERWKKEQREKGVQGEPEEMPF